MKVAGEIDKFAVGLDTTLRKVIEQYGIELTRRAAEKTHVVTGRMKRSWGFTRKKEGIEVWNVAPYSAYEEFGTPTQQPHAPLRTTLLEHEDIMKVALEKAGVKQS